MIEDAPTIMRWLVAQLLVVSGQSNLVLRFPDALLILVSDPRMMADAERSLLPIVREHTSGTEIHVEGEDGRWSK